VIDGIERHARAESAIRAWLGHRESLIAYVAGDVAYTPTEHIDDDADAIAVTSQRLLILSTDEGELLLLDAIPLRETAVIHHKKYGSHYKLGHKLFGSDSELTLRVRGRTLEVDVRSPYTDQLALAASKMPSAVEMLPPGD